MIKKQTILIYFLGFIVTAFLMFGCGGGGGDNVPIGDTNADTNGDDVSSDIEDTSHSDNKANRLVCEEMLSEDFMLNHALSIETYNMSENPLEGAEEVATMCTINKNGNLVYILSAVNSNNVNYDSLLAEMQLENNMVEDNSAGIRSAYRYSDDELRLLTYIFLGSNNATTVTMMPYTNSIGLEEIIEIAQEVDRNLPDVEPIENTAPDIQCPDMISESELSSIFEKDLFYKQIVPNNSSNTLMCNYEAPESAELSDIMGGSIRLYCNPPSNQTTTQQLFQITEDMILSGHSDVINGGTMIYEDVQALPNLGSKAYFYTASASHESNPDYSFGNSYMVVFLSSNGDCFVDLTAYDFSKSDLTQQITEAAKMVDANLDNLP